MLETVFDLFPLKRGQKVQIVGYIQASASQVFISSTLLCIVHGFTTWIIFTLIGMVKNSQSEKKLNKRILRIVCRLWRDFR